MPAGPAQHRLCLHAHQDSLKGLYQGGVFVLFSCALVVQNVIPLSSLYICMLHVELEPAQDYLILAQRLEY